VLKKCAVIVAALALIVAGCSTEGSGATSATTTDAPTTTTPVDAFPVTIEAGNGSVTIDSKPERIVSISPTSTEVLFAIGAGSQVVAVGDQSNYPSEAPMTDLSAWQPNVEAIATYDPDLVFLSFDPGDVIAGLEAIGITVVLHGTAFSVDDAYAQWEQTGAATGHLAEAVQLVSGTQDRLDEAAAAVPVTDDDVTYYYELDDLYYTTTAASFIGQVLAPTGMFNIADEAPDPDGFGYPQLTTEFIVSEDPTMILLADTKCCAQNAESVAERPGWGTMTALRTGGVVELDDDIASRWGPRIADLLETVVAALVAMESVDA